MKRWSTWGVSGVLLLLVFIIGGCGSTPHIMNDSVVSGSIKWKVMGARFLDKLEGEHTTAIPVGTYLDVLVSVMNTSNQAQTFAAPKVKDGSGREYEVSTDIDVGMAIGSMSCSGKRINPGMSELCTLVYEVPPLNTKDTSAWTLQVTSLETFGGNAEIRLVENK